MFTWLKGKLSNLSQDSVPIIINMVAGVLSFITGFVVSFLLGAGAASIVYGFCGTVAWFGFYFAIGIRQVEENRFLVIERFGKYLRTASAGLRILCLPNIVDRVAPNGGSGDFEWKRLDLHEEGNKIDFKDASAGLRAQVWYRVGSDREDPYNFTYKVSNTDARIKEIVDGALRVLLQQYTIDEANTNLADISKKVREDQEIQQALDEMGTELDPAKGVIITDIVLSPELIDIRQESSRGKRQADRQKEQGAGYAMAILAIMERFAQGVKDDHGNVVVKPVKLTFDKAKEIYERQRALETIQAKPGNTHFISPDIKGMQMAIGINDSENEKKGGKSS